MQQVGIYLNSVFAIAQWSCQSLTENGKQTGQWQFQILPFHLHYLDSEQVTQTLRLKALELKKNLSFELSVFYPIYLCFLFPFQEKLYPLLHRGPHSCFFPAFEELILFSLIFLHLSLSSLFPFSCFKLSHFLQKSLC